MNPLPTRTGHHEARTTPPPEARPSVGVVVVAYEAAPTVEAVLARIPPTLGGSPPAILVADDASRDDTAARAQSWAEGCTIPVTVVRRPVNLGYGGNQQESYRWALGQDFDAVVLLHGDAQYAPELIPDLIAPILAGEADAVYGSRMLEPGSARRGGMSLTRRVGNRVLTATQNRLAGTSFSEWHSGFRAYRTTTLAEVDLGGLPMGFDFDTALMLRLLDLGARVHEVPIPTRYGDETSRVRLVRFGLQVLGHAVRHRADQRRSPAR